MHKIEEEKKKIEEAKKKLLEEEKKRNEEEEKRRGNQNAVSILTLSGRSLSQSYSVHFYGVRGGCRCAWRKSICLKHSRYQGLNALLRSKHKFSETFDSKRCGGFGVSRKRRSSLAKRLSGMTS